VHRRRPGHRLDLGAKLTEEAELAIVRNFLRGERLTTIPAQRKKRLLVLRYLAEQFKPGERYPEADVNWILGRFHPDYALLRRLLVDEELMRRQAGIYWRTGSIPAEWP
jgi:hypothetical protein